LPGTAPVSGASSSSPRAPTFKTFEEAIAGGIRFGQDIIDGKVPGCSVDAL
jgi:hypothetical protein